MGWGGEEEGGGDGEVRVWGCGAWGGVAVGAGGAVVWSEVGWCPHRQGEMGGGGCSWDVCAWGWSAIANHIEKLFGKWSS